MSVINIFDKIGCVLLVISGICGGIITIRESLGFRKKTIYSDSLDSIDGLLAKIALVSVICAILLVMLGTLYFKIMN